MIRSVRARVVATSLWLLAAMAHAAPIDTTASTTPNKANPISMVDPVLQIDTVVVSTLPEYADWPLLHKQLDQTMDQLLETGVVSLRDSTGKVVVLDSIDGAIEGTTVDNLLTAGYSLVIKPEQEPSLTSSMHAFTVSNDISQQIQAHLGVVMSEHFYISPPGQRALSPHTDGGDVFVHQWAGSKLWTLCVPTAPDCLDCTFADLALRAELAKSAFQGCTSYTDEQLAGMECRTLDLQENELLYVPRGVVHFARANTTGLSAHATYQVVPPSSTWIDMVVDECSLTATMRACNELKNQLLQADLGFRWLNFRFKDVHVAPVLPNKLITSEYSLHSTRLAELVVRPASNDESVTRTRRFSDKSYNGTGCGSCNQRCDDTCDSSCDWAMMDCDASCDSSCDSVICNSGCRCPQGWGSSSGYCNSCSSGLDTVNDVCSTCGKGTFHNTVRCLSCGSGTYQDSASHLSTSCKTKSRCPAGTYDANGGSSSSNTNCLACPAGSYQDATNHLETSCKTKTNTCPVGHYASNGGSTTSDRICAVCPDGTWMDINGNSAQQCYQKSVPCSPGQEVSNKGDKTADNICAACSSNSYQPSQGLAVQCTRKTNTCKAGEYVTNPDSLTSDYSCGICAAACAAGNYQASAGQTSCLPCPVDSYSDTSAATSCKPCDRSQGAYQDQTGQTSCDGCGVGSRLDVTTSSCIPCAAGKYQGQPYSTVCIDCAAGKYSLASASECSACPAGTYSELAQASTCTQCSAGKFSASENSISCARCSAGTYQAQAGQSDCQTCQAGYTVNPDFTQCTDVTPPELTLAPNAIVRFEALTNTFVYPTVTATDTSGERIVVTHTNNVQPDEVGTYDVTYSGEDSAKNKGVLVVQVIIFAARKPVIVLLGPVVMTLEVHTRFNDPMGYVIDEGEPNNLNNTLARNTSALDIDTLGTYYVLYSMHTPDSQGLTASPVRRTVHVIDTTPPVISLTQGVNVTVEAGSTWSEPGFSIRDNYDTMAIGDVTVEPVALNLKVPNGTVLTVDYMATDRSGNAVSITRYVLVLDRLAPTITLLNATRLTAEAGDLYFEFDAVAEDQLDDDVDLSITYPDGVTVGGELQPPSLPFDYSIVYTARDDVGNTAHATRNLTVVDTKAPSLEAITSEVHLEAGAAYSINASWYSVHDNYKATPTISTNVSALPRTHVMTPYRANVQITATDSQGNRNATSLRVLLVDTTAPMLTLITSNVTSGTDFHISDLVTAYDSNDGVLDSVVDMNTHGTNVLDLPSTPTCPVDRIRSAASNAYQQARAERIRSTNTQVVGDAPAGSTYTVDFIVTDAAGNSDSLRGVVLTLRDDTAPVIATSGTPTGQIEYTRAANQLELPLTASDNLDGDISSWVCLSVARYAPRTAEGTPNVLRTGLLEPVSHNFNDFAEMGRPWGASGGRPLLLLDEPVGTLYVVNASVMDGAGNTATRTFRYLIVDTTPPVLTLTYPGSYHVPYDTTFIDPGFTVFDESDDLSEHVLVLNADRVNPRFPGTYLVQYRTNDRYGNPAEAARTVIVDNFILPADDDIVTITYAASIILAPAARAFEEQLRGALGYPYIFVVGRHAGADTTKDRFNTLPGSASSSSSRRRSLQAATNTSFELCMRSTTTLAWVPAEALAGMIRAWNNSDVTVAVDTNDDVDTVDSETRQGTSASNSLTTIVIGGAAGGVILLLLILVFILHRRKQNRVTVPATSEDLYAFFDVRDADIWEVERRFVRLGEKLGNGAFGQVFRAWFCNRHSGEERSCAAKALKPGAPFRARQDFLSEMTVMKEIGAHPNIIGIFGHCLRDEPHILLVELAELGNLRDYLRKCRTSQSKPQLLGSRQLADFCLQIASGMSFLERKNVIHRDLAARNVLLSQSLACKICDFGLARSIENEDYETTATKLPVKWMAPESLGYRIYTSKSDVWSFGVTMWEIFSLGGTPYVKHRNVDILSLLADGYRLPKPRQAPGQADAIARMCWMHEADNRPTFLELVDLLTAFIRKKNFSLAEPEVDSDGLYEAIGDPTEDSEGSGIRAIMSGTEGMGAGIYESQINGDEIYDNEFDGHMMTEGPSFENMAFSTDSAQASIGFGFFPAASVGERCQPSVFDRNANEEEALQHSETTIYDLAIDDLEI